ncbi:MAG TPA: tetratricopeptide repeat protein [Flavobacteriales bacterium]|nr:tetratricopeptide repeat protein [Flavobacteriales bacterium]
MNDGHHSGPNREIQQHCVQRYESMLHRKGDAFFDVEEFELIIDHYLEQNNTHRAKEVLELAQKQHPGSLDVMFSEAIVLMNMGRLTKALEVLDAIGKLEPFNEEVHLHKAGIYSQLRNYRRAIEHYKRALELADEGKDDILLDLAFEYENIEGWELAVDSLKKALEINPENEAVLYELAYVLDLMDANQVSVAFFKRFTNEYPYSFVAWFNLGNALSRLERFEESNEALELCLAIEEKFSSAYFSKARNLLLVGQYEKAIECYNEALANDGPQAITFSYIGECYEKMERYEQALIHYDQAIALDPNWVDAWIGRGVVKDIQGNLTEAVKDLAQAVKLAPDHGDAWFYYANGLARDRQYEASLAAYMKLNTVEPENLDGWLDHADLLLSVKSPEAALRKLREGEQVHKLNARYKYRLASYLLRSGAEQQALLELEEALMTDHSAHDQFLLHYPEAANMPQVIHLLELYKHR